MPIEKRLLDVLTMIRPGIEVPIIVSANVPITSEVLSQLESVGMEVTSKSNLVSLVYGRAVEGSIAMIAALPFVTTVHYDEPVTMQMPEPTGSPSIKVTPVALALCAS